MILNTPLTNPRPIDFLQPSPTSQTGGRFPQQPYPLSDDRGHTERHCDPQHPQKAGFHDRTTMSDDLTDPRQPAGGWIPLRYAGSTMPKGSPGRNHLGGVEVSRSEECIIRRGCDG
jgi:hypothetical protein